MIWVTRPCYSQHIYINHQCLPSSTRSFAWRFPHHHPWPNLLDPNIQQVLEHPTPDNKTWKTHVFTSATWIFGWILFLVTPILCTHICIYVDTVYIYICMVCILYAYKIGGWNMTCMNVRIKHFANLKGSCEDLWVSHVNCICVWGANEKTSNMRVISQKS